jgi:hypothetical protein
MPAEDVCDYPRMNCSRREALSVLNNRAIRVFIDADQALCSAGETADAAEYRKLQSAVSEARIEAELARRELEHHERQHHCGSDAS